MNVVFTYSIFSNKMRIHNMHWAEKGEGATEHRPELGERHRPDAHAPDTGCSGYRIKDQGNCCTKMFALCCKM